MNESYSLPYNTNILNMVDGGVGHTECPNYGDDVEADGIVNLFVFYVVVDGMAQVAALLPACSGVPKSVLRRVFTSTKTMVLF